MFESLTTCDSEEEGTELTWEHDEEALSILEEMLLQLASEFKEELVAGRGRLWAFEEDEQEAVGWS